MYQYKKQKYIQLFSRNDFNGKIELVAEHDTIEDLVAWNDRGGFECYSSDFEERYSSGHYVRRDKNRPYNEWAVGKETHYCFLVFDQDGTHYSRERLIGYYREWASKRVFWWQRRWFSSGKKRKAYSSGIRHIRTFQEHKWAHAWDDEEFAPKCRSARQAKNLPNTWDDYWSHNDKCWKTQSKRKRQWKPK